MGEKPFNKRLPLTVWNKRVKPDTNTTMKAILVKEVSMV